MLGPTGVDEILSHPWARLHVITGEGPGSRGEWATVRCSWRGWGWPSRATW
jgi:hypothetical protein